MAERLLLGEEFKSSRNAHDWLGHGVYFWEANPKRGLSFAKEALARSKKKEKPTVVGAVIDLGHCLDMTTEMGITMLRLAYDSLKLNMEEVSQQMPVNSKDMLKRPLDCAVFEFTHQIVEAGGQQPFDTVRGVFVEGGEAFPGSGFPEKTHIQIAVRKPDSIKGVFRVPRHHLS
ncbi:MAG: hypothetical protein PHS60_02465 [Zavarzinia sp.]|nr:hypothetical protein [Zavarzinia sp.]